MQLEPRWKIALAFLCGMAVMHFTSTRYVVTAHEHELLAGDKVMVILRYDRLTGKSWAAAQMFGNPSAWHLISEPVTNTTANATTRAKIVDVEKIGKVEFPADATPTEVGEAVSNLTQNLKAFRSNYPEYNNVSDAELVPALTKKYPRLLIDGDFGALGTNRH